MHCTNCSLELPKNAKFCPDCGIKTESSAPKCATCGEPLKPSAKFCHNCGEGLPARLTEDREASVKQSKFATVAMVLFIPIFAAGIIALLFWKNQEPQTIQTSNAGTTEQGTPSMAAMGMVHETLQRLKNNLESNPNDVVSLDSLAIMYSIAGSYDKASGYYERHLEIEPDNKDVKIALGLTYHNLNRTTEAIALIQAVLAAQPDYPFALFYLGEIQAASGDPETATENWKKIMERHPNTEIADMAQQRIHELNHVDNTTSK